MSRTVTRLLSIALLAVLPSLQVGAAQTKVETYEAMLIAVETDDSVKLESLLSRGADPNASDNRGVTILMRAAVVGNIEPIKVLLRHGAGPNRKDPSGNTALMHIFMWHEGDFPAFDRGPEAGAALLKGGASIGLQNRSGMTPLMRAAGWRHPRSVEFLLSRGADINRRDDRSRTALTWAARDGTNSEAVRLLLAHGAKIGLMDALLLNDRSAAINAFEKGVGLKTRGPYGETPLMAAAENADSLLVRTLLDHGADPNAHDDAGVTALISALAGHMRTSVLQMSVSPESDPADSVRLDVVKMLLAAGARLSERTTIPSPYADIHHYYRDRTTALQFAIAVSPTAMVRLLIDRGADIGLSRYSREKPLLDAINHRGSSGRFVSRTDVARYILEVAEREHSKPGGWDTALVAAADSPEMLRLLLDHGANVNSRDASGRTALMMAAMSEKQESVTLLLAHSAEVRLRDNRGCSALTFAANNSLFKENQDLVPLLRRYGAPYQLIDAVLLNDMSSVRSMLDAGASPNVRNGDGDTALLKAVSEGNIEVVDILLKHGANLSQKSGWNLLSTAVEEKNGSYAPGVLKEKRAKPPDWFGTARLLIAAGVEINPLHPRAGEIETPLVTAIAKDDESFVRFLLDNQADPRVKFKDIDNTILTAMDFAKQRGKGEIVAMLEQAVRSRGVRE